MKKIIGKEKNRSIFYWAPTLALVKYPEGQALVFAWGYYILVLKDRENNNKL